MPGTTGSARREPVDGPSRFCRDGCALPRRARRAPWQRTRGTAPQIGTGGCGRTRPFGTPAGAAMRTIRVSHLYPDYLNIYADRGNIAVFRARARARGYELDVRDVSVGDAVPAGEVDLFYVGGGQDR